MHLIPDVPPEAFTGSAVIIGYLLIDDTTANEQNALGNWLMLIAQILCTNAYFIQVQNERGNNLEKFGRSFTDVGTNNNVRRSNMNNSSDTRVMLEKLKKAIDIELNNLNK